MQNLVHLFFPANFFSTHLIAEGGSMNPETFLVDLAKYLPPIVGCMGAFIPLLMYAAIVDHFREYGKLIFAMLGIEIWFAYLVTAKYGASFGYPDELTIFMLAASLVSLAALVWYVKTFAGRRHFLKWTFVLYSTSLVYLSVAASNFFGFASLHIYLIRNRENIEAATIAKNEILSNGGDPNGVISTKLKKQADDEYKKVKAPKQVNFVEVVRDDAKPKLYVTPSQSAWSNDYYIILTGDLYRHFKLFEVHVEGEPNPYTISKDLFREDISRWAYGDVYEAPLRK